ncbi:aldehyde dehydrogenase domain-containing protein [Flagelloscypha sp. PMI_526]|nr:aldehyde dehydrogenase domain-containing protein [Flagelloscypha sp. PMI_526]
MSPLLSKDSPLTKLIINGIETKCSSGNTIPLVDPSTSQEWLRVDEANEEDVNIAVGHAESAFQVWSTLPSYIKASTIRKFGELIMENKEVLIYFECKGNGKPISQASWDVPVTVGILNHMAALCETDNKSAVSTNGSPGFLNYVLRESFGVTAGIIPWNVPMIMFASKVGPAVAAGNAIIIKPSEKAPLTSLLLGSLATQAGFSPGLIQVLPGYGPSAGAALARHVKIRKISFTGSVATGRLIQEMAAKSNLKNVSLELGGKSPNIIFQDVDIPSAASACAQSILSGSGQTCFAASRIYVHTSIKEVFLKFYTEVLELAYQGIGHHLEDKTTYGPVVDRIQFQRVQELLKQGDNSEKIVIGGGSSSSAPAGGYFIPPTIFTSVADSAEINIREIFGPIVMVHTFDGEAEVIKRANDSEYGLYGAVFTKDIDRAMRVSKALEVGSVGINCTSPVVAADMLFGGYKASGIGREGGPDALHAWQEMKSVYLKIGQVE